MEINLTEKLSETELEQIKRQAPSLEEKDIYTFEARLIDDQPTANGRIWSQEWQQANVENFVGVPVVVNHENDQSLVLGRVFAAEQKGNAIFGKVYVPLNTDVGQQAKEKIQAGLFKSVSINASANETKQEGDVTRILPGKDDRVFEVSFVAVPGCATCSVTACESAKTEKVETTEAGTNAWIEFAKDIRNTAINETVKAAAFVFGTSKEASYRKIAEKLSPDELRLLTNDLKETYETINSKVRQESEEASTQYKPLEEVLKTNRR